MKFRKNAFNPAIWSPIVAFSLLAFLFSASPGSGQIRAETPRFEFVERAPSQLMCTISTFFSFESDDVAGSSFEIEGRGLATCTNDEGFETELPVYARLEARVIEDLADTGEVSFSANTSTFIVPRDINQIEDRYEIRPFSWNKTSATSEPTLVFRGTRHDLVIETKFAAQNGNLSKVELGDLRMRIDDSAPDLTN